MIVEEKKRMEREHVAIIANGVLAESYLDCDNRYVFEKLKD
jgi:hypothetical protein